MIGSGDHHNPKFDKWGRDGEFSATVLDDGTRDGLKLHQDGCTYKVHVVSLLFVGSMMRRFLVMNLATHFLTMPNLLQYPSQLFWESYNTDTPLIITCSIVAVFLFTIVMFLFYGEAESVAGVRYCLLHTKVLIPNLCLFFTTKLNQTFSWKGGKELSFIKLHNRRPSYPLSFRRMCAIG